MFFSVKNKQAYCPKCTLILRPEKFHRERVQKKLLSKFSSVLYKFMFARAASKMIKRHSSNLTSKNIAILITDPCYVSSSENIVFYKINHKQSEPNSSLLKPFVQFNIDKDLYNNCRGQWELEDNQWFFKVGVQPAKEFLGAHHSDSGMTCLIDTTLIEQNKLSSPIDWQRLLFINSEDMQEKGGAMSSSFYKWWSKIPEGGKAIKVYGHRSKDDLIDGLCLEASQIDSDNSGSSEED